LLRQDGFCLPQAAQDKELGSVAQAVEQRTFNA
jgi:hypothetical protein